MIDILLEIIRASILGGILGFLLWVGKNGDFYKQKGWSYVVVGSILVFLGSVIDITDNFPRLNAYIIIGDTPSQAFLEKVLGSLLGYILIFLGFWHWLPLVSSNRRQAIESELKYQSLMNQSPDFWFVSRTDDLRFTEVNGRACEYYGYSHDEFLSMSILDVEVDPPTLDEVRVLYDKFPIGHVLEVYGTNKRKDGTTFPVHVRFSKIDESYAIANVRDITQQKMAEDENRRQAKQSEQAKIEQAANLARTRELQASRQRMVEAGESVRKEMARQLHGGVQNKLIVLAHQIHHLNLHASNDKMAHHLEGIEQSLKSVIDKDVRQVSRQLYPSILSSGLVPGLQSLLEGIDQTFSIRLNLDQNLILSEREENKLIPESIRLAAYRIVEEAVTNAVKHANASLVQIDVDYEADVSLQISVSDDGQGFDMVKTNLGFGTLSFHDLAETSGGSCSILSEPGKGTHIRATFPLQKTSTRVPIGKDISDIERQ